MPLPLEQIIETLKRHEQKDLLRFVAFGSVDDGKSTLIGRLLHDTHGVYEDQLSAVKKATKQSVGTAGSGAEIDFSLFTDGLKAEREQGITIDVAYRYFSTEKRKFIIADTPGHVQYTRNMATGASTASVGIILIDARLGVLPQSRRHAYIASLLGIAHLVVGVNKMDLVGYDRATFEKVQSEFAAFAAKLGFRDVTFLPISALRGDNVVTRSAQTPWHTGPTLLEYLEEVPLADDVNLRDLRIPVQTVLRPNLDYRGYAGQIASGVVRTGDRLMALPSRKTSRVVGIDTYGGSLEEAFAPMSITVRLADEIDVSRGEMLVLADAPAPRVTQTFDAMMVWMHERPLDRAKSYFLKHTTQTVRAEVQAVGFQVDLGTLEHAPADKLGLNDIGQVTVHTHRPLFVDAYRKNHGTGAFVLVDSLTNDTVAAGMILEAGSAEPTLGGGGTRSHVSPGERRERLGHSGAVVVVDASAPGALAFAIERGLFDGGAYALALEQSDVRVIAALVEAGVLVVCAADEPTALSLEEAVGEACVVRAGAGDGEEGALRAVVAALESKGVLGR
jgi:bifunctional enzyme CysN/CysC